MPGIEFYQTQMGHKFYEGTMPSIARSLEKIAESLEKLSNPLFAVDLDDEGGIAGIRMLTPGQTAMYMAEMGKLDELLTGLASKGLLKWYPKKEG